MPNPPNSGGRHTYQYLILGAGRQGVAAAFDLAKFGEADRIHLVDSAPQFARRAARRVNELVGRGVCSAGKLEADDERSVARVMLGFNAALSAVPYFLNVGLSRAAVKAKVHFCDLGGNLDIVRGQLKLHAHARKAGKRAGASTT